LNAPLSTTSIGMLSTWKPLWSLRAPPLKLGRIAEPREVTDVVLFLASDRASFVNGVSVNVDGGQMKPVLARMVYGRRRRAE
jgi:3-oxoacyl-[acyl-carrier protein] reductase